LSQDSSFYRIAGFSLLELAIVLFILGILLVGVLVPLAVQQEQVQRNDTEQALEDIREAIIGFALSENRLPCPDCACPESDDADCYNETNYCSNAGIAAADINDGFEDRSGDSCDVHLGNIPWATLGMNGRDSWGNNYTFQVSPDYTGDPPSTSGNCTSPDMSFTLCHTGNMTVHNDIPNPPSTSTHIAEKIPAIVVSHGQNFTENDPSGYEIINLDDSTDYVQRDFSQREDEEFDDLLIWISPHTLRLKMVEAGLLP